MSFKIIMQNSGGGELDSRVVETEEQIKSAVLEMVTAVADMYEGDRILVTEVEE